MIRLGVPRQGLIRRKPETGWTRATTRKAALVAVWIVANVIGDIAARHGSAVAMEPSLRHLLELMAVVKAAMAAAGMALVYWRLSRPTAPLPGTLYGLSIALMAIPPHLIWHVSDIAISGLLFHGGLLLLLAVAYFDRDDVAGLGRDAAARWMDVRGSRR